MILPYTPICSNIIWQLIFWIFFLLSPLQTKRGIAGKIWDCRLISTNPIHSERGILSVDAGRAKLIRLSAIERNFPCIACCCGSKLIFTYRALSPFNLFNSLLPHEIASFPASVVMIVVASIGIFQWWCKKNITRILSMPKTQFKHLS